MKKLKLAYVADPISKFHPEAETTFYIMKEATQRGHENWIGTLADLFVKNGEVWLLAQRIEVTQDKKGVFSYKVKEARSLLLKKSDVLFLRKDPPVNETFMDHLSLLELLEGEVLMINSPKGIKSSSEKIYPFHFNGISPPTLIAQSKTQLMEALKEFKLAVLKPLNGFGGEGIVMLRYGDKNTASLLELITKNYSQYVMLQKFIPQAKKGDKRVLVFNGQYLGSFLRVASTKDFRCNLHSGGHFVKTSLTQKEERIIQQLKPELLKNGLYFVGLDFIGEQITEINTTSPMGLGQANLFLSVPTEKILMDGVEKLR